VKGSADFIEWDVHNWSGALDFWAANSTHDFSICTALEVGARHGGLSLWLAQKGAKVVCSDVSGSSEQARRRHSEAGVSPLVEYARLDAVDIPYSEHFDIILFKSVIGAVGGSLGAEGQARAIAQMHQALKPGGELFFAENLVASPLHAFARRHLVPWGRRWRYVRIGEMLRFLAPFSHVTWRAIGFAGAFGRNRWQQDFLGVLDEALLNRVVPRGWRYIMVGVARR
jgi:SAM-dependent methyltransferase